MLKLSDLARRSDFEVGTLSVSPSRRLVSGPSGEAFLEPLVMQVFLLLLDAKGKVVTRDEIFEQCWGGALVGDSSLNRAITLVRQIADQTGPGLFEIENIPRTGYRLIGDLQSFQPKHEPSGGQISEARKLARGKFFAIGVVAAVGLGLAGWLLIPLSDVPVLAVTTVARDPLSTELAHEIEIAIDEQGQREDARWQMIAGGVSFVRGPDFTLRIGSLKRQDEVKAELVLVSERENAIIWSGTLQQPANRVAALRQQAEVAGVRALVCAAETHTVDGKPPDYQVSKLYLDACTRFENGMYNTEAIARSFAKVVAGAPTLGPAWSKLFVSDVQAVEDTRRSEEAVAQVRRHLAQSRQLGIALAETHIAQAELVPVNDHLNRLRIYEAGLAKFPDSVWLHTFRGNLLSRVGRRYEGVLAARTAARLAPNSPGAQDGYITAVAFSGRTDAAHKLVREAEARWPDSDTIKHSRYVFDLRLGDPRKALRFIEAGNAIGHAEPSAFLIARLHPNQANIERAIEEELAIFRLEPRYFASLVQTYGQFGRIDEAIQLLLNIKQPELAGYSTGVLFRPALHEVRRDPRFIAAAAHLGLLAYWKRSGKWPDFCFEPGMPYECKIEARKYRV